MNLVSRARDDATIVRVVTRHDQVDFGGTRTLASFRCVVLRGSGRVVFSLSTGDQQVLPRTRARITVAIERRRIDPHRGRWRGRKWLASLETRGVCEEGSIQGVPALGEDGRDLAPMDLGGRAEADAAVVVLLVVPVEEAAQEAQAVLVRAEAIGKFRAVLQGLELRFGERVVVGRRAAGGGSRVIAQVGQQLPERLATSSTARGRRAA